MVKNKKIITNYDTWGSISIPGVIDHQFMTKTPSPFASCKPEHDSLYLFSPDHVPGNWNFHMAGETPCPLSFQIQKTSTTWISHLHGVPPQFPHITKISSMFFPQYENFNYHFFKNNSPPMRLSWYLSTQGISVLRGLI